MSLTTEPLVEALRQEWTHLLKEVMLKLDHCLCQLSDQQACHRPGPEMNSVANHLAHLTGNLYQWSVTGLNGLPDQRMRESEFADFEPRDLFQLKMRLLTVTSEAYKSISQITADELLKSRTIQGFTVTGLQAINHTITHLVGHTHQIVQLTRWQLGEKYRFHWTPELPRTSVPI